MVSILINHESMCWKEDEIDRLFIPEEAAAIKAIPLVCSIGRTFTFGNTLVTGSSWPGLHTAYYWTKMKQRLKATQVRGKI